MMNILSAHDGPGIVSSQLVGHPGPGAFQGDCVSQPDKGNGAQVAGWSDDVPRLVRAMYSYDVGVNGATSSDWVASISGAATARNALGDATHQAYWSLDTGTSTGGRTSSHLVIGTTWVSFGAANTAWRYWTKFKVPTLTDGTNTFGCALGFHDSNTSDDPTDGAYVRLGAGDGGVLQCITSNNSTRTTTTSGITIVADTWYLVDITVNTAATVDFYIWAEGTVKPATPTVTISTNIPSGVTRGTAARAGILKSAGTTARTLAVHYQVASLDRTAA